MDVLMKDKMIQKEILDHYYAYLSRSNLSTNSTVSDSYINSSNNRSNSSSNNGNLEERTEMCESVSTNHDSENKLHFCITALKKLEEWDIFMNLVGSLLGIKDLLLLEWYSQFGGRLFVPVTGGGHTSEEVIKWMTQVFMPQTTMLKEQSSRIKNAYGLSEFPGISVNGVISNAIDLELVPVPEKDIKVEQNGIVRIISKQGELFDPSKYDNNRCCRGEIRVRHRDLSVTISYWRDPVATEIAVRDGWFYTGNYMHSNTHLCV